MSKYIRQLEREYENDKITLSQLTLKRDEYNKLSDQEKEKLDYPNGIPKDEPLIITPKEVFTEDEKTTIRINGNESIKELVNKVNECDSIDEKMGVCLMIITVIETRNGIMPGGYKHDIALSIKYPPKDPAEHALERNPRTQEINAFLFYLKGTDYECYEMLVDSIKELSDKETAEFNLVRNIIIGAFILFWVFIISMMD